MIQLPKFLGVNRGALMSYHSWVQTKPMPESWIAELTLTNKGAIKAMARQLGCPISPNLAMEYRKFLLWILEGVETP